MSEVYLVAVRSDKTLAHIAYQTEVRVAGATLFRDPEDAANLQAEVDRFAAMWLALDGVTVLSWRRITAEEHDLFNRHRNHRDALEMKDGKIQHNMDKARELHKHLLRHQRGERLVLLDGAYSGALATGDTEKAKEIEAIRAQLRDNTSDPRIAAAQTIEELVAVGLDADGEAAYEQLREGLRRKP